MGSPIARRALPGLLVLGLSACSQGTAPEPAATTTAGSTTPGTQDPASGSTAPSDGGDASGGTAPSDGEQPSPDPYPEAAEARIDIRFADPGTGDELAVLSVLRHAPSASASRRIDEGGEVLYLQVEAVPGPRAMSAIYGVYWHVDANGLDQRSKISLEAEVAESGRTPFDAVLRGDADPGIRWVPFLIPPPRTGALRGAYVRPAGTRSDGGVSETVPEFRHEFDIPAA